MRFISYSGKNITAICANTGSLYVGTDQGVVYTDLSSTRLLGSSWGTTKISSIALDPNWPDFPIIGTYGQDVWLSYIEHYGSSNLPDMAAYVNNLIWFSGTMYTGSGIGVWASTNRGNWIQQGSI